VFTMTQSYYKRLTEAGVRIFEYEPGIVHAKVYLSDDQYAIVGTVNLDYRSLVHHFENGVWLYNHNVISDIKNDVLDTVSQSIEMNSSNIKNSIPKRFVRSIVRIFSPML
ncbi:MAG: cardiolipin synthase, partial [Oscillospiraceae bacterium]|nr:cardiolipin synthase [Oscillospiraceae bacterium]